MRRHDDDEELVRLSVVHGTATITLDSPKNRNALSLRLVTQLFDALEAVAVMPEARVVVISHTGTTFCAGADLSEAADPDMTVEEVAILGMEWMVRLMRMILELPKPVIARVDGHARGGGLGIIGACDMAVAGPGCTFAFTEVRLGVTPAVISLVLRPRIEPRALNRYFLTGEVFGSDVAQEIGLITEAVKSEVEVDIAIEDFVTETRKGSPQGLHEAKALVVAPILERMDVEADWMTDLGATLFASVEAQEGIAAFLQKRHPDWDDDS